MIKAYYSSTGNSMRVIIALEESGLKFEKHKIDIRQKENRTEEFLKLNPLGFIPVIIDEGAGGEKLVLNQSGAILLFIAEKSGKFLPIQPAKRYKALQWLFSIVSDINPMNRVLYYIGENNEPFAAEMRDHFIEFQKSIFIGLQNELGSKEFILDEFSLVDIALYSITRLKLPVLENDPAFATLMSWYKNMSSRATIKRAYDE